LRGDAHICFVNAGKIKKQIENAKWNPQKLKNFLRDFGEIELSFLS